ncbi:MAG: TraR/DksA C4-type zinc finger protein [Deltaproteobacteria bacterium]|nr:TraR/DksA C4-type zinc finger protein [Deltaproteobacteria bacterium]
MPANPPTGNPLRESIETMIREHDLRGLLRHAGALHGHLCNYLAYGVMAGAAAVRDLEVRSTGMEEVVAVLETNNCFADGVQIATGCSFGNNALVYRDLGKTAFTLVRRDGQGVRYLLDPDFEDSRPDAYPEAYGLWNELIVAKQQGSPEKYARMMQLFHELSLREIDQPLDRVFRVQKGRFELPAPSMMFPWVRCARCGENVMETRIRRVRGDLVCLDCARENIASIDSRGIGIEPPVRK